jgi:hypothetical protein
MKSDAIILNLEVLTARCTECDELTDANTSGLAKHVDHLGKVEFTMCSPDGMLFQVRLKA